MRAKRLGAAAIIAVALLVPPILAANGIRLLANDWYVRFEYGRLPADSHGFTRAQRTELGLRGLHSVLPGNDEGIGLLRRARLPSGARAFREKELRHMADVRRMMGVLYTAHLAALGLLAALAVGLALTSRRRLVVRGVAFGAALTLGIVAFAAVTIALSADGFLTGFHTLFFEGESWRFRENDTLRRLYPDRFWSDTAIMLALGAAAQAGIVLGTAFLIRRRQAIGARRRTPLRAPARRVS